MKETKIKTSSLSLALKPGIKILVRSITFLLSEKTRPKNKRQAGFNNKVRLLKARPLYQLSLSDSENEKNK